MYSHNRDQSLYQQAMDKAVRLLAQRAHTCKEIEIKLRQRNYNSETIAKVISECRRLRYIDDTATAALFVAERKRKHYGPRHIKQSMQKKGFSLADIEKALKEGYPFEEEMNHAQAAALKKDNQFLQKADSQALQKKLYTHLLNRGFSAQVIRQVLFEK